MPKKSIDASSSDEDTFLSSSDEDIFLSSSTDETLEDIVAREQYLPNDQNY